MIEKRPFLGQPNCYQVSNGTVEVIVSTDFGPRVLRYGFCGGENMFGEYPELRTPTPLGDWKPRGGHRLWVAPEEMPQSYAPDDAPLEFELLDDYSIRLQQPTDAAGFEKQITVELAHDGTGVSVRHRLTNRNRTRVRVAPWAITIMRGESVTLIPQEPFRSHDDCLVPARAIVVWYFTDLTDPRISLGKKFLRLRTDAARAEPQKIGAANRQGWCAWHHGPTRSLFVKRFPYDEEATYPDFGANVETYTAGDYMEVETLGPPQDLEQGEAAEHTEHWQLFRDVQLDSENENVIAETLMPLLG
ncbi:MAG: hypothetical protein M3Z22_03940 [Verrucomicrobiota bacterium]|nr:hypothetical protein [Verrucomicrobiota bacterium]